MPPSVLEAAETQHDLVTLRQLTDGDLSYKVISRMGADGTLHEVFRGVFRIGSPALGERARWMAAVLAAGPGAALSHRDGGVLLGVPRVTRSRDVDVTVPRGRRPIEGIDMHPVRRLDPGDVCVVDGIRVTTRPRTFVDLGDEYDDKALHEVFHEAEVAGLFDPEAVRAALDRTRGRDCRRVRRVLACWEPHAVEQIEPRLEAIAARAGLPEPERNVILVVDGEACELDRYYPQHRLVLEADGFATHRTRRRFRGDRRRDRRLAIRLGITTLRYTWEDVTVDAARTEQELRDYVVSLAA